MEIDRHTFTAPQQLVNRRDVDPRRAHHWQIAGRVGRRQLIGFKRRRQLKIDLNRAGLEIGGVRAVARGEGHDLVV